MAYLETVEKELQSLRDQVDGSRETENELKRAKVLLKKYESRIKDKESVERAHLDIQAELQSSQNDLKALEKEYYKMTVELAQLDEAKRMNAKLERENDALRGRVGDNMNHQPHFKSAPRTPSSKPQNRRENPPEQPVVSPQRLGRIQSSLESIAILSQEDSTYLDKRQLQDHLKDMRESLQFLQIAQESSAGPSGPRTRAEEELVEMKNSYRQLSGSYAELMDDYSTAQNKINSLDSAFKISARNTNGDLRSRESNGHLRRISAGSGSFQFPERPSTPKKGSNVNTTSSRTNDKVIQRISVDTSGGHGVDTETDIESLRHHLKVAQEDLKTLRQQMVTQVAGFDRERRLILSVMTNAGLEFMSHHRREESARRDRSRHDSRSMADQMSPTSTKGTPKTSLLQRSSVLQTPRSSSRNATSSSLSEETMSPVAESRSSATGRFVMRTWLSETRDKVLG